MSWFSAVIRFIPTIGVGSSKENPRVNLSSSYTDFESLERATSEFFVRHWSENLLGCHPRWEAWQEFLSGSVPNYQFGGCYALFEDDKLVYVGLGASRGGGRYLESGISRRMMSHVYCSNREPGKNTLKLRDAWLSVNSIYTIGLPDRAYLATALESFLIRELSPPRNKRV